jgi:hypothetical protein
VHTLSLDVSARLVLVQFSFSNINVVPKMVRRREAETKTESLERKERSSNGSLLIEPCENVSVEGFASSLEAAGYELVDGVYQMRQHPTQRNVYHMVRFVFSRRECAEISESFEQVRPIIRTELDDICRQAFWRTRAFSNPFYKDGEEIHGVRSLSFNFEVRVPRFLPDGQLALSRRKDESGKKVGDPVPLEPARALHVKDGKVALS